MILFIIALAVVIIAALRINKQERAEDISLTRSELADLVRRGYFDEPRCDETVSEEWTNEDMLYW